MVGKCIAIVVFCCRRLTSLTNAKQIHRAHRRQEIGDATAEGS